MAAAAAGVPGGTLAVVAAALLAGGCGTEETRTTTTATTTAAAAAAAAPADAVATAAEPAAASDDHSADAVTADGNGVAVLRASAPPVEIRVRLVSVDEGVAGTETFTPQRDNRLVGIELELTNLGDSAYTDTVSSGAVVVAQGREHRASLVDAAAPALARATIAAGATVRGFVTVEVPKSASLESFRLRLNSGFGPETGEWMLAGG